MYRCILVPVDGTEFGEQAIPHAVAIALRCRVSIHLAHVHLPPIIPSGAETAALPPVWIEMSLTDKRRYLEGLASRIRADAPVQVETRIMEGSVASALERHAVRCGADLIVMSTHGHSGLSRLWHHGVADQLARDLPIPVLLIHPEVDATAGPPPPELSHILVPLDGSADSELIIEHAATLARPFAARLTLIRVERSEGEQGGASVAGRGLSAQALQNRTAARQYLNGLAERLRSHGMEVSTEVLDGEDVAGTILQHIQSVQQEPRTRVDLIAIVAPQRGVVTRLFVRGVADELVRRAPVPVLLYERQSGDAQALRRGLRITSPVDPRAV